MAESAGNWCLIESDPGVFTELIREFGKLLKVKGLKFILRALTSFLGCKGIQVEELWSLNDEKQFENLK